MSYRERPKVERELAVRLVADWHVVRSPSLSPWDEISALQQLEEAEEKAAYVHVQGSRRRASTST